VGPKAGAAHVYSLVRPCISSIGIDPDGKVTIETCSLSARAEFGNRSGKLIVCYSLKPDMVIDPIATVRL
jgi:hypothetical protein